MCVGLRWNPMLQEQMISKSLDTEGFDSPRTRHIIFLHKIEQRQLVHLIFCCLQISNSISEIIRIQLTAFTISSHLNRRHWYRHKSAERIIYDISRIAVSIDDSLHNIKLQRTCICALLRLCVVLSVRMRLISSHTSS